MAAIASPVALAAVVEFSQLSVHLYLMPSCSKKTESRVAKSECAAAHKKKFALFLLLTGLIKVSETKLFDCDLFVWVGLVIEFERVIGVREVLLCLFFDFSVGFDPIKKHGVVARVFSHMDVWLIISISFIFSKKRSSTFKKYIMGKSNFESKLNKNYVERTYKTAK